VNGRDVLTVAEVAERLGCHPDTARRYTRAAVHPLPSIRVAGRILIPVAAYHQWLNTTTGGGS
jgi:excisionase family DNA binding protein